MNVSRSLDWFRSLRWGRAEPGAVLWWICQPNGQCIIADELRFQDCDPPELVALIRAKDDDLRMLHGARYTAAEPKLWEIDEENAPTLGESFARAGLPLIKSSGDRIQGWNQLSSLMKSTVVEWPSVDAPVRVPALVVSSACKLLVRTLPLLKKGESVKEDIDVKKGVEACVVEALRIGVMSRPAASTLSHPRPPEGSMGHALEQARIRSQNLDSESSVLI